MQKKQVQLPDSFPLNSYLQSFYVRLGEFIEIIRGSDKLRCANYFALTILDGHRQNGLVVGRLQQNNKVSNLVHEEGKTHGIGRIECYVNRLFEKGMIQGKLQETNCIPWPNQWRSLHVECTNQFDSPFHCR